MPDDLLNRPPLTRQDLVRQVRQLGVAPGDVLMVHCSLSSLGYVVGGADTVVGGLLEVIGPGGTLVAMTGWAHDAYDLQEWPHDVREAYLRDPPRFDPDLSEAADDYGRTAERIRTWRAARHSSHPEARFSAIGYRAQWIVGDHPWHHPYGPGSPLAKLVEAGGRVLMLGAPLETLTILHHAEELAEVQGKAEVVYPVPVHRGDGVEWRDIHDIETSKGALPYEQVVGERDAFEVIGEEALARGIGTSGRVGTAVAHLFPAEDLLVFGVAWIESHFA